MCVQETITGLALSSVSDPVEVGMATDIMISMDTGSHYSCEFTFVNSDTSVETGSITDAAWLNYTHTFTVPGSVTVYANCSNSISLMDSTIFVMAMERITGYALSPPGAMSNVPFHIVLAWTTGTHVQIQLWYDGVEQTMVIDEVTRQATSPQMSESVTGLHNVSYTITNDLESAPFSVDTLFSIEIAITNPSIVCTFSGLIKYVGSNNDQAVIPEGSSVECTISMDAGTSVVIDMVYNDGSPEDQYNVGIGVPWSSNALSFPLTHTFATAQFCAFHVTVSNGYNSFTENFPVWVMVGVDGVQLNPQAPETFYPPASVTFDFTYSGSPPNDVTCYIEWGDGNDDEYYPCDITGTYTHEYMDKDGKTCRNSVTE